MSKPIIVSIEKLIGTLKVSNIDDNELNEIQLKIQKALIEAVKNVNNPPKDFTEKAKVNFDIQLKTIWTDDKIKFSEQLDDVKKSLQPGQKIEIIKHYIGKNGQIDHHFPV